MKKHWERLRPHVDLDPADIVRMVAAAMPGRAVQNWALCGTGLANSNFRVDVAGPGGVPEPVLLRIYMREPDAAAREAAIARRFAGSLPLPEVLCESLDVPSNRRFAVYRWSPGTLADAVVERGNRQDIQAVSRACGAALAAIQTCTFPSPGSFRPDLTVESGGLTPPDYVRWIRTFMFENGVARALGAPVAARVLRFVEAGAPLLAEVQDDASLVHCDYNGANILVMPRNGTWEVSAVLDWEFACSGSSLIDVGNMLRHYQEEADPFEQAFIAGFRDAGGRLPPEWRRIADLYDLMSLCGFLENRDAGERVKADVTGLVLATLARWGY